MKYALSLLLFPITFLWNVVLGRCLRVRPWWSQVDQHVWIGALPFRRDVPALAELGVAAVVNTCREYAGPVEQYQRHGIEQLRLPTIDFQPPTLDQCREGVAFIERHVGQGHNVYVHCKAGRARSATIVVCWLMASRGMTPEQAQAELSRRRPHVNRRIDRRPAVRAYWDELRRGAADEHSQRTKESTT